MWPFQNNYYFIFFFFNLWLLHFEITHVYIFLFTAATIYPASEQLPSFYPVLAVTSIHERLGERKHLIYWWILVFSKWIWSAYVIGALLLITWWLMIKLLSKTWCVSLQIIELFSHISWHSVNHKSFLLMLSQSVAKLNETVMFLDDLFLACKYFLCSWWKHRLKTSWYLFVYSIKLITWVFSSCMVGFFFLLL